MLLTTRFTANARSKLFPSPLIDSSDILHTTRLIQQTRWQSDFPVPGFRHILSLDEKKLRKRPKLVPGVDPAIKAQLAAADEEILGRKFRKVASNVPFEPRIISFSKDEDEIATTPKTKRVRKGSFSLRLLDNGRALSPKQVKKAQEKQPVLQKGPGLGIKPTQNGILDTPWFEERPKPGKNALRQLEDELAAFGKYLSPTQEEVGAAETIIAQVRSALPEELAPIVVGSRCTGLALPMSDIDLHVQKLESTKPPGVRGPSPNRPKAVKERWKTLHQIAAELRKSGSFRSVIVIKAQVPLVSAIHIKTSLEVQIQGSFDHLDSVEYTKSYRVEYPAVSTLHALIKVALSMRGLASVVSGGLGSYSLFMMIVASMKMNAATTGPDQLALHLLHFLKIYSKLDYNRGGVSVEPPGYFERRPANASIDGLPDAAPHIIGQLAISRLEEGEYRLCLQDPADPWNDLGRKTYRIKEIQAVFREVAQGLSTSMTAWSSRDKDYSLLAPLVGGDYSDFEQLRDCIQVFGKSELQS